MSSGRGRPSGRPALTSRHAAAALALVLGAALSATAAAQTLYKLVGRDGRVTYTDTLPKGYDGEVTRIEMDPSPPPPPPAPTAKTAAEPARKAAGPGVGEKRRKAREDLERRLQAAQARLDAARKARAAGEAPAQDDMQVVQRRYAPLRSGETPPRANCFNAPNPATGVVSMVCPVQVPGEKHYRRQDKLDEEVALAEDALRQAERDYRRGTD